MSYESWFENHSKKHINIINNIKHLNDDDIIEYFKYNNMVIKEPDFCPLYKENKKCHNIEDLNCYLCGCPNFRLVKTKSYCDINSKDGETIEGKDGFIHQDCSRCFIPHNDKFIKEHFNKDWQIMMSNVL